MLARRSTTLTLLIGLAATACRQDGEAPCEATEAAIRALIAEAKADAGARSSAVHMENETCS